MVIIQPFLSSAYVVSPGPTSRNSFFLSFFLSVFLFFCFSVFFHSVSNFLGASLVKDLASGIPLIQDIEPSNSRDRLSHATLRFLDWLSSATLKIFISGVSSNSDFDAVESKFGLLVE